MVRDTTRSARQRSRDLTFRGCAVSWASSLERGRRMDLKLLKDTQDDLEERDDDESFL
jgi:hypothetical protein